MTPARHSLAWLRPDGWAMVRAQVPLQHRPNVDRWSAAGWPAVVRQREPDCPAQKSCLGLALPPDPISGIKHRLPLQIDTDLLVRIQPARTLRSVLTMAPQAWQRDLSALDDELTALGLTAQVFGSLALQAVTGLVFLRTGSDIDLLVNPATHRQLDGAIATFNRFAGRLPLDGEVVFPCGAAVAFKEWCNAAREMVPSRVLAKRHGGVALLPSDGLLASLKSASCCL